MELAEGYKKTEIGVIPVDWEFECLKSYCKSSAFGPRFSGELYNSNGNVATLRTTDLDLNGNISYSTMPLAVIDVNQFKDHILLKNDFLITRSGTCGIAAVFNSFDKPVLPGAFLIRFRFKDNIDVEFFRQYINSPLGQLQMEQISLGAVQKNISGTSLLNTYFPFPSITEQTAIAAALSDTDALINSLEKLIAKKRNIKQGAMQKLLQPKEGWEVKKLGDIAGLITKGTTPTSLGRNFQSTGINFIKIESLTHSGEIITDKVAYIDEFTHQLLKRSQLKCGDILFSIAGALGRVAVVENEILPANTNQALAIIRLASNSEIDLKYLFIYLTSIKIQSHILNVSVQGAQANLSLLNISQLLIEAPKSQKEQTRIATILSDMDAEIAALETKLEKYRRIKMGMMQNLLTGKIRLIKQ